jgi:hypothetical protein
MRTTIQLLAGMCAFTLVACGSGSDPIGSAEAGLVQVFQHERGACGPENKEDEEGDQKDLCDGAPATVICVKAGTMCYCATESETYNDCYVFDLEAGDVTRIREGRDCKGISHTEYECGEPPKCPPDSNECMDDKDCDIGYVCGMDGCCEPAPKCPDSNECMDDKECDTGYVCGMDGCCEPAPKCPDSKECTDSSKDCLVGEVCLEGCCALDEK